MRAKLLGRIGRLGGLAAVCACAALATGASAASATEVECASITGSGSSLQNVAQKTAFHLLWLMLFNLMAYENLLCKQMVNVEYEPTSSGKGLAEWGAKTGTLSPTESFNKTNLDGFVGADVAPEGPASTLTSQLGLMDTAGGKGTTKNKVTAIPIAQSAIGVLVTLPENCEPSSSTKASVKNMALSEVWSKKTTLFTELMEGVTLTGASCSVSPLLEAREVGSGTTGGFKRYLGDLEPSVWDSCTLTAANSESASCWGSPAPDETGNETGGEEAEKVFSTSGTIGYADLADALKKGFIKPGEWVHHKSGSLLLLSAILWVRNGGAALPETGEVVSPEGGSGEANCANAEYAEPTEVKPDEDWSKAKQSNATGGKANVYPICTLTFDLAWEHYSLPEWGTSKKYTEAETNTVFGYLRSIVTEGQSGAALTELKKEHFFGVPSNVQVEDEAGVTMKNILF